MNENAIIHRDRIPTDDAAICALITDAIRDAATDILESHRYFSSRFDMISDYDDYIPAAARIAARASDAFLSHTHATPRDCLDELLDDDDFIDDCLTADFSTPLFELIDYRD